MSRALDPDLRVRVRTAGHTRHELPHPLNYSPVGVGGLHLYVAPRKGRYARHGQRSGEDSGDRSLHTVGSFSHRGVPTDRKVFLHGRICIFLSDHAVTFQFGSTVPKTGKVGY